MTEEEMAKKYAEKNKSIYGSDEYADITDYLSIKEAFLAGLKAGKPKWRKVADGNYPLCEKGYYTVNVLTNDGDIAYYDFNDGCWIAEPSSVEIDPPIAWCEIPKYTEE